MDIVLLGVAMALMVGIYQWRLRRRREELRDSVDVFRVPGTPADIRFLATEKLVPLESEIDMVRSTFEAMKVAWPDVQPEKYTIWFVRSPDQRVGWRTMSSIPWVEIPIHNGPPPLNPANGYGGMGEDGVIWVATFIEGRDPAKLVIHEMTHALRDIALHGRDFLYWEAKLVEEWSNNG